MFAKLLDFRSRPKVDSGADAAQRAGELFASGVNCAQAVLQAVSGRKDEELMQMAKIFGGGIAGSKCLCGAVTGGAMALALAGRDKEGDRLVRGFREKFGATCCSVLSRKYVWKSREHLANCRFLAEEAARTAEEIIRR
jgi:C_GCAxxG_C_C family probable redox protein